MQDEVISSFEFYAGLAEEQDKKGDEDLNVPDENMKITVRREPLGVCGLITPWNVGCLIFQIFTLHPCTLCKLLVEVWTLS